VYVAWASIVPGRESSGRSMKDEPSRDVVVFTEALKVPVQERGAFLERVCAGDENCATKWRLYCEPRIDVPWVISPNGVDAQVVFDGSASFAPGGAVLLYEWWADGTFAFTAITTNRFQVGRERVRLTVGDGAAASTDFLDLHVVSPATVASVLRDVIEDAAAPGPARNSLTLPLRRAEASFDSADLAEGVRQVEIFRRRVLVQPTGTDAATTAALAALAQELIDTVQQ